MNNIEHQQGIKAFEHCLKNYQNLGRSLIELPFEAIGIEIGDIEKIKSGEKYITEEQFCKFVQIFMNPMQIGKPLIEWLLLGDNWALVGILKPTFLLKKNTSNDIIRDIRAILDFPYVIINNPALHIEVGDSLSHICPHGGTEKLFVENFNYSSYPTCPKPVYIITVTRSKPNMPNTNNFNIAGDIKISNNSRLNVGNVTDNSSNIINKLPPEFFDNARNLLENVNETYRQDLIDLLNKIEKAPNKKERGILSGKFLSLSFIADCVTILQPFLSPLFQYLI